MVIRKKFGALSVVLVATAAVAIAGPTPAQASTGSSSCVKVDPAHQYSSYVRATNDSQRVTATTTTVVANIFGSGEAFDCGPAGRPVSTTIDLVLKYEVSGSRISCTVSGGSSWSISCNATQSAMTITKRQTCRGETKCTLDTNNLTIRADSGGSLSRVTTSVSAAISGSRGSTETNADAVVYQR